MTSGALITLVWPDLFGKYSAILGGHAVRCGASAEESHNLARMVWLHVLEHLPAFDSNAEPERLCPWLVGVMGHRPSTWPAPSSGTPRL